MKLFKNGVGRPSNETLRKRKIFVISAIAVAAVVAGLGIFVGIKFVRGDMSSGLFNLASSPVSIKIEAVNADSGKVLGTYKNQEVYLSNWRNYKVGFNVKASTTNSSIKSIVVTWNDGGYNTTKGAEASISKNKKTVNGNIVYFDFTADGIRFANVTATDDKGKTRTIKVRASIDKTKPTLTFKVAKGTKRSDGSYPSGTVLQATCSDSISGVTYMKTFDAQDTSDYRTYNSSAVKSKSQQITMVTTGSKRYITTTCKDKAGNSTGNKNSTAYGIGVKPAVNSSAQQNQQIIETITGQNNPRVTVTAINLSNNATISTTRSGNSVLLSGWRNYKVRFKIAATSPEKGTTIKSIKWSYNAAGITSTSKSNYMTWIVKNKTFNGASANLDFTVEGARRGSVTVTDSKGRTSVFQIGANIDLTKPKVKLAWKNLKSAGNGYYYIGSSGTATCSDSLSGVNQVVAYEGLNTSNKTSGNGTVGVVLKNSGTNYFVGTCKDKAGNSASKTSTKHYYIKDYTLYVSSVSGNATSWTKNNVTLKVSAKSTHGVKSYSFDNGKTWQTSNTKSFSKNQTVYIKVKDKKGNISNAYTVKITKIDKTAPTIKFGFSAGTYKYNKVMGVTCTDSGSGIAKHKAGIDGNSFSWVQAYGNVQDTRRVTLNKKGKIRLSARCVDKAGNDTGWKFSSYVTVK